MGRRTPLYDEHLALNAKMVPFAGFDMPVRYSGIQQEHRAVREAAGLFDVSHMGEFFASGPEAGRLLQRLTVNDLSRLKEGRAQYTLFCNEQGGIVDDLIIYRLEEQTWMLVVNAANIQKDWDWIQSHADDGAAIEDRSDRMSLLALQGPASATILSGITDSDPGSIPGFSTRFSTVAGQPDVIVSATGYTGEKGFELYIDMAKADPVIIWKAIYEAGREHDLEPAGLGARDTLRLEMGYPLYGNDLTDETTPIEAGLGWLVKSDKGEFVGRDALLRQKSEGVDRKLTGFVMNEERSIPRKDYIISDRNDQEIGRVTSGSQSVSLGKGIGMGYVSTENCSEGEEVLIRIRRRTAPAILQRPPFL